MRSATAPVRRRSVLRQRERRRRRRWRGGQAAAARRRRRLRRQARPDVRRVVHRGRLHLLLNLRHALQHLHLAQALGSERSRDVSVVNLVVQVARPEAVAPRRDAKQLAQRARQRARRRKAAVGRAATRSHIRREIGQLARHGVQPVHAIHHAVAHLGHAVDDTVADLGHTVGNLRNAISKALAHHVQSQAALLDGVGSLLDARHGAERRGVDGVESVDEAVAHRARQAAVLDNLHALLHRQRRRQRRGVHALADPVALGRSLGVLAVQHVRAVAPRKLVHYVGVHVMHRRSVPHGVHEAVGAAHAVGGVRKGEDGAEARENHLSADEEVLQRSRLIAVVQNAQVDHQRAAQRLPESEEDDGLDDDKLQNGLVRRKQVSSRHVKQQQRVQRHRVADVVEE